MIIIKDIIFDDMIEFYYLFLVFYCKNVVWILYDIMVKVICKFKDNNGNYIW